MVGRGRGRPPIRRNADRGNEGGEPDPRDLEIERLQQRIRELELSQHVYSEETDSELSFGYEGYGEDENPFSRYRPERRDSNSTDPLRNLGVKVEIPDFDGHAQPDDFIDWLHTVERVFDLRDIPDKTKVKLVAIKLRKTTSLWWEHMKQQRRRDRKSKVESWAKMRKLLCDKFLPLNHRQEAFLDYHNITQGVMSVETLIAHFDRLRMRCAVEEEEEQTIARLLGALNPEISNVVQLQQYWTYNDVCRLALKVEKQEKSKDRTGNSRLATTPKTTTSNPPKTIKAPTTSPAENVATGSSGIRVQRCFRCQGVGHIARECPNKHVVMVMEDLPPRYDEYYEENSVDDEFDEVGADHGEALVIHRVLNTDTKQENGEDVWRRNSIFRTKCTAQGKVCNMIIDGGSCENVISTLMVEKLRLKVVNHPSPYQLAWLKKGNTVKVDKKCLVQFSIGTKYKDEVWCEVVPMDACHILLGRPWQFDRRTVHDGFRNTYQFRKDGVNITLMPLDIRSEKGEESSLVLCRAEFQRVTLDSNLIFALIVLESNTEGPPVPPLLHSLLKEFEDVFPIDIPSGLH